MPQRRPAARQGAHRAVDGDDLAAGVLVDIGSGDAIAFSVEAPVLVTAAGTLENTAKVDSDSDPNDLNDTDTDVDNLLVLGPCGAPTGLGARGSGPRDTADLRGVRIHRGRAELSNRGDATFRAGIEIILKNGFSIESGGKFVAEIDAALSD